MPDTPLFNATMDSIFQNTATLDSIQVFDDQGELMRRRHLGSRNLAKDFILAFRAPMYLMSLSTSNRGDESNTFNNNGHGVIPVAILGSAEFDVTQIDLDTVEMGSLKVKVVGKNNKLLASLEDANGDSYMDYVVKIEDTDVVFKVGNDSATLIGSLLNGELFQGSDAISIVPDAANSVPEPNNFVVAALLVFGTRRCKLASATEALNVDINLFCR